MTVLQERSKASQVLVTGASGYIGGRLVPRLLEAGYRVRCLAREPRKLHTRPWAAHPGVEILQGDISDRESLLRAMEPCFASYYLVHSMLASGATYAIQDRTLALEFAAAASKSELTRIIYLGGLGETGQGLSEHLSSRREVESALASTGVPVTVLRAAMIIGSGSASFEILRYLVERLPVMITPRWVRTESQPIAVRNVLQYLIAALETPETLGRTLDIGGPEVLSYREMMRIMASSLKLPRRLVIPVPVLTPRLSSLWIHLITPLSAKIARPLAEGLKNRVVCRNNDASQLMPQRLLTVEDAIEAALAKEQDGQVETSWSDAGAMPGDPDWAGGTSYEHVEAMPIAASAQEVFSAVCRIGGRHGWFAYDYLWRIRGAIDRLAGGPGLGRGRRSPIEIQYGDALDFWRVVAIESDRRLELRAEMKLPGIATLEFLIEPEGKQARLTQIGRFEPRGLVGILYWYSVMPLHRFVFRGMVSGIRRVAEKAAREAARSSDSSEKRGGRPLDTTTLDDPD